MTLPFPPLPPRKLAPIAKSKLQSLLDMIKETPEAVGASLKAIAQNPEELVLSPLRDAATTFFSAPEGERMADASYLYAKAGSVPGVADPGQIITRQNTASVTPRDQWKQAATNTAVNALTSLLPGGTVAKRAAVGGAMGAYYNPENPIAGAVTGATLGELLNQGMKRGIPGLSTKDVSAGSPQPASAAGVAPAASFLEGLYSRVGRAIDAAPFEKGTGAQWRAAASKGAPAGERQWSGLDDYLAANENNVLTRQQVAELARAGRPQLTETVRQKKLSRVAPDEAYRAWYGEWENPVAFGSTPQEAREAAEQWLQRAGYTEADFDRSITVEENAGEHNNPFEVDDTKYAAYQVPGEATGYREVLVKMAPTDNPKLAAIGEQLAQAVKVQADAYERWRQTAESKGVNSAETFAAKREWENAERQADALRNAYYDVKHQKESTFTTDHWPGEKDVLGHTRWTDRTTPAGERALFLEDLQSDWHQAGREQGYRPDKERQLAALIAERDALDLMSLNQAVERYGPEVGKARDQLQQQIDELVRGDLGVPDAPFRKTSEWTELLLKRALDETARGGYDRMVLPTGKQAAEMFRLDKQLPSLDWLTQDGGKTFSLADPNGDVLAKSVPAAQLPAYVGKEVAQRIVDGRGGRNYSGEYRAGTLSGDDFKVEAPGMRQYYDNIVVNTLRDYLKTLGEVPVEPVAMFPEGPNTSVRMTPTLRDRILQGQRLWAGVGALPATQLMQNMAQSEDLKRRKTGARR